MNLISIGIRDEPIEVLIKKGIVKLVIKNNKMRYECCRSIPGLRENRAKHLEIIPHDSLSYQNQQQAANRQRQRLRDILEKRKKTASN